MTEVLMVILYQNTEKWQQKKEHHATSEKNGRKNSFITTSSTKTNFQKIPQKTAFFKSTSTLTGQSK